MISFLLLILLLFFLLLFFQLFQVQSQVVSSMFFLFHDVELYCYKISSQKCFYCISQVLSCCVCIVICFQKFFDFPFDFFSNLLLFRNMLFNLHLFVFLTFFFLVIDIQSHGVVVVKDAGYDFNFLKFTEACFCDPRCGLSWRMVHVH